MQQKVRTDGWGSEVGYWVGWLLLWGTVVGIVETAFGQWWPAGHTATRLAVTIVSLGGLVVLIRRRQRRNGEPVYSWLRATGLGVSALLLPFALLFVFLGLRHLVHA